MFSLLILLRQVWMKRRFGSTRITPSGAVDFMMEVVTSKTNCTWSAVQTWLKAVRNLQLYQQSILVITDGKESMFGHPDSIRGFGLMKMLTKTWRVGEVSRQHGCVSYQLLTILYFTCCWNCVFSVL